MESPTRRKVKLTDKEELIKYMTSHIADMKNRRFKAKNYNDGSYWDNKINQLEIELKKLLTNE